MLEDAPGELSTLDKTVLDSLEAGTILSCQLEPALDDRLTFGDQITDKVARIGGIWPLILVFVGVLGGMDRHERPGPAATALQSLPLTWCCPVSPPCRRQSS
jgi:hypothetical protein